MGKDTPVSRCLQTMVGTFLARSKLKPVSQNLENTDVAVSDGRTVFISNSLSVRKGSETKGKEVRKGKRREGGRKEKQSLFTVSYFSKSKIGTNFFY